MSATKEHHHDAIEGAQRTAQKEHPILFSTPMVQAILENRKSQTRRIVKGEALKWLDKSGFTPEFVANKDNFLCPYGQPGDLLWVRETWKAELVGFETCKPVTYYYLADNPEAKSTVNKFKPSIHMPKEAARIWLEVEEIGVERLQDISELDAIAEGIEHNGMESFRTYRDYLDDRNVTEYPLYSYQSLWIKINGPVSWLQNPWVWVVEFKVLSISGKENIQYPTLNNQ